MSFLAATRRWLYVQLDPEAWHGRGLSPVNWVIFGVIWISILFGLLGTEPAFEELLGGNLHRIDKIILSLFAIEILFRIIVAGLNPRFRGVSGMLKFLTRPATLADLIVIAPIFLATPPTWTMVFRLLRILRLFRLATMPYVQKAMAEFFGALAAKRFELGFTACIGVLMILISSTSLYLLEGQLQPEVFGSIPRAVWWSVVTFTTVGYGDAIPITAAGRMFAGVYAICGLGLVAMLTGVIASALNEAADRHSKNKELEK